MHTVGPGVWGENWKSWTMRNIHLTTWKMMKSLKNAQALVAAFQDLMIPRQGQLLVGPFFCRCESGHDKCSVQCQSEGMDHGGAAGIFPDFLFHETAAFFQPFAISFLLQNLCNFPAETGDLLFGWFFLKTEQGIGICFQKPCKGREQCDIRVSDARFP